MLEGQNSGAIASHAPSVMEMAKFDPFVSPCKVPKKQLSALVVDRRRNLF
jgi:hypothetical protein